MATPPTFVSYGASVFNTTTTPKTVSITVAVGDRVVVMSHSESAGDTPVNTAPTGNGETYNQAATLGTTTSHCRAIAWTMTATAAGTYNVSAVAPQTLSRKWGVHVWVYRDSDGFGTVGAPAVGSTSNSVTLTTAQANSALVVGSADWNAIDGTTRTRRTINSSTGTEDVYGRDSAAYTWYGQHYADAGAAGSVTAGYSAPTGQASAIIAVEIKGTAATAVSNIIRRNPTRGLILRGRR
jgi:hypothetical protein